MTRVAGRGVDACTRSTPSRWRGGGAQPCSWLASRPEQLPADAEMLVHRWADGGRCPGRGGVRVRDRRDPRPAARRSSGIVRHPQARRSSHGGPETCGCVRACVITDARQSLAPACCVDGRRGSRTTGTCKAAARRSRTDSCLGFRMRSPERRLSVAYRQAQATSLAGPVPTGDNASVIRSLLFVPGHRGRFYEKLPEFRPDAVIVDLEDAVPPAEKPLARSMVRERLGGPLLRDFQVFVRVNAVGSPFFADDVRGVVADGLDGIFLPKAEYRRADPRRQHAARAERAATRACRSAASGSSRSSRRSRARSHAAEIVVASPRVMALAFGAEDFTPRSRRRAHARRHRDALSARPGRPRGPRRRPHRHRHPLDRHRRSRRAASERRVEGRQFGYTAKQAIHPSQIAAIHRGLHADRRRGQLGAPRGQRVRRGHRARHRRDQPGRQADRRADGRAGTARARARWRVRLTSRGRSRRWPSHRRGPAARPQVSDALRRRVR